MATTNKTKSSAKSYWASLDELREAPDFAAALEREFPEGADSLDGVDRRRFLQLMGASAALAGVQSCRWEKTNILPFDERPEGRVPGIPSHFATSIDVHGMAQPVVATSYDGRPIKIEGNELHPESQGAATIHGQAVILEQYDPERSKDVLREGEPVSRSAFEAALAELQGRMLESRGAGLGVLVRDVSSPSIQHELARLREQQPEARIVAYEPVSRANALAGSQLAYGRALRVHPRFERADRILALDCDFLVDHPGAMRNSKGYAKRRKPEAGHGDHHEEGEGHGESHELNRLYAVESRYTPTGAQADHRLPLRAAQIGPFLAALETRLLERGSLSLPSGSGQPAGLPEAAFLADEGVARFLDALTDDLLAHSGHALVLVGDLQGPEVHALAHRVNALLGAVGETLVLTEEPQRAVAPDAGELAELVDAMRSGAVTTLVVLEGNPVYDAPRGLGFAEAFAQVPTTVHLGLYRDETARAATWHAPANHVLESWGDARAWDGSYCLVQPLIRPLYDGWSALELVHVLRTGQPGVAEALVRASFERAGGGAADGAWQKALHDGFLEGSASQAQTPALRALPAIPFAPEALADGEPQSGSLELVLHADPKLRDGRYANSGWLQELPDFLTKLTWDNAALLSPATAAALGVTTGDQVQLTLGDRSLFCAVYVQPGQAKGTVSLALGYGRTAAGLVGGLVDEAVQPVGFDAYELTGDTAEGVLSGLSLSKSGGTYAFAATQEHHQIDASGLRERSGGDHDPKVDMVVATAATAHGAGEGDDHGHAQTFEGGKPGRVQELIREATAEQHAEITAALAALGTAAHGGNGHGEDDHAEDDHSGDDHGEEGHDDHGDHHLEPNPYKRVPGPELESLWTEHSYDGKKWGLAIDLSACTGCNACVIACQSENNIPVVGKEQVSRGREMQWIRIDTYYAGPEDAPEVRHQPMACIQCELAPCEQVCPVAATVHSHEGLNDMVYNRCVGTRYCSNNCPVKVRRFNFFNYHKELKQEENTVKTMGYNPEVTVRHRGVMEKCTYCVQRIQAAKIRSKVEKRDVRDGEIVTACQQTCPADAITFGDLADHSSEVSHLVDSGRSYHLLAFLNIKPRTNYLARITNPNPALAEA